MIDMKTLHTTGLKRDTPYNAQTLIDNFINAAVESDFDIVLLKGASVVDNTACLTKKNMCLSVKIKQPMTAEEAIDPVAIVILDTADKKTQHEVLFSELTAMLSTDVVARLR
jgi:hypothetical protein